MEFKAASSWTRLDPFDQKGFFIIKNVYDEKYLQDEVPKERGMLRYVMNGNKIIHEDDELQVSGSVARYNYPKYKYAHSQIRLEIEKHIGRKLLNTYYYDRFYFPGQRLEKHIDRDACEISISVHVGSNLNKPYPFKIQSLDDGRTYSLELEPGDGVVYKGCHCVHWRDAMPGGSFLDFLKRKQIYYHQSFFHYVLADGIRSHCAGDVSS